MIINEKNILNLNWQFYIARNIQMWHDSLYVVYGEKGYKNISPLRTNFCGLPNGGHIAGNCQTFLSDRKAGQVYDEE